MPDPTAQTFESALQKLEGIVKRLEKGDISLEQSLKLFEEGIGLSHGLRKQLNEAESRVEILMKSGDDHVPKPFDLDQDRG